MEFVLGFICGIIFTFLCLIVLFQRIYKMFFS